MRLWQTKFQVIRALETLPVPRVVVLEKQDAPTYHVEENMRGRGHAQIVCTIKGEGAFRLKDKVYRLTPGMTFMACEGNPDLSYYYPGHATEPWLFLWICFSGRMALEQIDELNNRYGHVFELPLNRGLVKYMESFENQRDTIQLLSPTEGAKIVYDALAALGETLESGLSSTPQAQLTRAARELIDANLSSEFDMARIAEKLGVSREHLTRVFRSQAGMSPGHYATSQRMRVAARMVLSNTFSCKEIAQRLGYESASSFARAFKSHYAVSPANFKYNPMQIQDVEECPEPLPAPPPSNTPPFGCCS